MDRRASAEDRRAATERRVLQEEVAVERRLGDRRKKVPRRRQIDPTTCERDYSELEIEFMRALDDYKRASGRMFPTCSEILEVVRHLGYEKVAEARPTTFNTSPAATENTADDGSPAADLALLADGTLSDPDLS
jgi:hypothetical protein